MTKEAEGEITTSGRGREVDHVAPSSGHLTKTTAAAAAAAAVVAVFPRSAFEVTTAMLRGCFWNEGYRICGCF